MVSQLKSPMLETVHATWNPTGARTGRWASRRPNLMNQPWVMKNLFKARDGFMIIDADFSQIELRIMALLSGDESLLRWYAEGWDVHTQNARDLFGVEKPTKNQRNLAKRFVYAVLYGAEDETIWSSLVVDFPSLSLTDVSRLKKRWNRAHPAITKYQRGQLKIAYKHDYVEGPMSGRRLFFYGQVEPNKVYNTPNQDTGAVIVNGAVKRINERIDWENTAIIAQVHDSIVLESRQPEWAYTMLIKEMQRPVTLNGSTISFPVDVSMGYDMRDLMDSKWGTGWLQAI